MATTYVLLNEYIPEIKFKGKLLNSDVVTVGETATFDARLKFCYRLCRNNSRLL